MMGYSIAIIGGGPMCTYALERLAALLSKTKLSARLCISIFERTGRFGAGEAHSDIQSATSYMNRIAGQIAFAADESNLEPTRLLPKSLRPTFLEWCQTKYSETGEQRFNLLPRDVPKRYMHGLALRDMFQRYVTILRDIEGVSVDLYASDVTDVSHEVGCESRYRIHVGDSSDLSVLADRILFVTGHSRHHPVPHSTAAKLVSYNKIMPTARYIPYAYPMERQLTEEAVPPRCAVGIEGLGLTAIDIFIYLTEGRGGTFIPIGQAGSLAKLKYLPSGREPALMIGSSPSGMFTLCRPDNAKEGNVALEHKGVFFTIDAVRKLRQVFGKPVTLTNNQQQHQLDFERHVFPLILLEMAFVYYKTLFGKQFGDYVRSNAELRYRNFLQEGCPSPDAGIAYLLEPIQACFDEVAIYVSRATQGEIIPDALKRFETMNVVQAFLSTLFGSLPELTSVECDQMLQKLRDLKSPWGHSTNVYDHRFDWQRIHAPLLPEDAVNGENWRAKVIAFIEQDLANAAQNNLNNPVKAACDGVWRDLRSVFSETVDRGGLLPDSHRCFISKYLRYYNRLSNGAGIEPMKKILALIDCGLLNITIGPSPVIEPNTGHPSFRISGSKTGVVCEVDVVIDGKLHAFDPERDTNSLYLNLLRRGLVQKWCNPGPSTADGFYPGGLDLSDNFHPVQRDGTVNTRLTFLGSPAEGVRLFQSSAARPYSNSYVLNNVATWANELFESSLEIELQSPRIEPLSQEVNSIYAPIKTLNTIISPSLAPDALGDKEISTASLQAPSITDFRSQIRAVLEREANAAHSRHIVILGIDGIPYDLALRSWSHAKTAKMRSVFPSTSSTAWLSSLSGMSVDAHGVPGVIFKVEDDSEDLINIFEYKGQIFNSEIENIFSDAVRWGYAPLSILGDLEDYDCSWRDLLLRHSQKVEGHKFYTVKSDGNATLDPLILCRNIRNAIMQSLELHEQKSPCLLWCFIDTDLYIHHHGYDDHVMRFLELIDQIAVELAQKDAIIIAHSDHGLTPTCHDSEIEQFIGRLKLEHHCSVGGAGRTRWIYPKPGTDQTLMDELARHLPTSIRIGYVDDLFLKGSLSQSRVGKIMLIAQGEAFLTSCGYSFDHGSLTDREMYVPLSEWIS